MNVLQFASTALPLLKSTDSVSAALEWMQEFKTPQLVVFDKNEYLGIITEEGLLNAHDETLLMSDLSLPFGNQLTISPHKHILEAFRMMNRFGLELIPVMDEEKQYLGCISYRQIVQALSELLDIKEAGAIVVLEIQPNNYALSEIARITESVNAIILNLFVTHLQEQGKYYVTLKTNILHLEKLVAAFERYHYQIIATYTTEESQQDLHKNYHALMKYLEMENA